MCYRRIAHKKKKCSLDHFKSINESYSMYIPIIPLTQGSQLEKLDTTLFMKQ